MSYQRTVSGVITVVLAAFGVIATVCVDEIREIFGLPAKNKQEPIVVHSKPPDPEATTKLEAGVPPVEAKVIEYHYYHGFEPNEEPSLNLLTWFCDKCANRFFTVTQVSSEDPLNVRDGPGTRFNVLWTIPPASETVICTGNHAQNGDDRWVEIQQGEYSGWVNQAYLY